MRRRLLLALVAVPVLCATVSPPAAAQRYRGRDHGRTFAYRTGGYGSGYRYYIYLPSHGYKEPGSRSRVYVYRGRDDGYRYRDRYDYRYRDGYGDRYRDDGYGYGYRYDGYGGYRDGYVLGRHASLSDLLFIAAEVARYHERYDYRRGDRHHRHRVRIYL